MSEQSQIRIESLYLWDFDLELFRGVLKDERKKYRNDARKLVARNAISKAGEYPGKRTGHLEKTLTTKMFRTGLGFYMTHILKSGDVRYPFILAYGRKAGEKNGRKYGAIEARKDYIAAAAEARRAGMVLRLRETVKKSIKAEKIV